MQSTGTDIEINVNSITIRYDDLGNGIMPVIFVHGFPFNKSTWQPQMDFLKSTTRVIAYDIRGFGNSTTNDDEVSIGLFADDLIKFMDVLQINKAIVCGLSMGGYILLNAIDRYPNRFEALILSDTQCIADTPEIKAKRQATIKQIESGGLEVFTNKFIQSIFCEHSLETKKALVAKIKKGILSTSPLTIINTLKALAQRQEKCYMLQDISIPTLILCGKEDAITPTAQSEFLQTNISGSRVHIIDNSGHLTNLEQVDVFNDKLEDFITELPIIKNAYESDSVSY